MEEGDLDKKKGYTFYQTEDQITVSFFVPPKTASKQIQVDLFSDSIRAGLKGEEPIVQGMLFGLIDKNNSLWEKEVGGDVVTLHLEKRADGMWPALIIRPSRNQRFMNGIDVQSQYNIGVLYESGGAGLPVDLQLAFDNFKASAEKGYHPSQLKLGIIYQSGRRFGYPIESDINQAITWLERAAERGNDIAIAQLAATYHYGLGGAAISYKRAADWYRKQPNSATALFHLGQLYENEQTSEGWDSDIEEAVKLWKQSAKLGSPEASYRLGMIYYSSNSNSTSTASSKVERNLRKAKRYFEKAYRLSSERQFLPPADIDERIAAEARETLNKIQTAKREAEQSSARWRNLSIFAGIGLLGAFLLHRAAAS